MQEATGAAVAVPISRAADPDWLRDEADRVARELLADPATASVRCQPRAEGGYSLSAWGYGDARRQVATVFPDGAVVVAG
jgi:hypothetical protein